MGNKRTVLTLTALTPPLMEVAFRWLCRQRKHYPDSADVWHLRYHWHSERDKIYTALIRGEYRFTPLSRITTASGEVLMVWSAADALVIKCLTLIAEKHLPVHPSCGHVKGQRESASIQRVRKIVDSSQYAYVCRTDIRQYYGNINKDILYQQITSYVQDEILLDLFYQFLHYTIEFGGLFYTLRKGIARGSSLSPLLAAFHLYEVDNALSKITTSIYIRYMDDFLIFTRSRWQLKRAVKYLNQFFATLGFVQHPDKTQIGKVKNGFDWLGAWFDGRGNVTVAPRALSNFATKLHRLYEQTRRLSAPEQQRRVEKYIARWMSWLKGGGINPRTVPFSTHCRHAEKYWLQSPSLTR